VHPKFTVWILAVLFAGFSFGAAADDIYLICHLDVPLQAADVRDVFLGEKQFLKAVRLVLVDNLAAQSAFLDKVLKMNRIRYATTWAKKSFRDGVNPPAVLANDDAVVEFVRHTPGGCGYLGAGHPDGFTVIAKY
jgi:hypothetical protein